MGDLYLSPQHYRQQGGILNEAGTACKEFGRRPLVLGDAVVLAMIRPALEAQFAAAGLSPSFILFGEECCKEEISRVENIARRQDLDFLVGTGGGKAIDTSRMVAARLGCPFVTIPTSALSNPLKRFCSSNITSNIKTINSYIVSFCYFKNIS